ncbi:MAG: hypothetical protein M0Z25_06690 [Nitrospiraceae bacterium]|nr:hypothetical protein [Nitrospiraceae bacterium]
MIRLKIETIDPDIPGLLCQFDSSGKMGFGLLGLYCLYRPPKIREGPVPPANTRGARLWGASFEPFWIPYAPDFSSFCRFSPPFSPIPEVFVKNRS